MLSTYWWQYLRPHTALAKTCSKVITWRSSKSSTWYIKLRFVYGLVLAMSTSSSKSNDWPTATVTIWIVLFSFAREACNLKQYLFDFHWKYLQTVKNTGRFFPENWSTADCNNLCRLKHNKFQCRVKFPFKSVQWFPIFMHVLRLKYDPINNDSDSLFLSYMICINKYLIPVLLSYFHHWNIHPILERQY